METKVTPEEILKRLKKFDWESHWKRVIDKVDKAATEYEIARYQSRRGR